MYLGQSHTDFWWYAYSLSLIGRICLHNTRFLEMVMTSTHFTKLHLAIGWAPVRPPFSSSDAQVIWRGIYPFLLIPHWALALTLVHCYPPTHPLEKELRLLKRNPLLIKRVGIVRDSDFPSGRLAILFCWLSTFLACSFWCVT